ncbi:hypothetical protein IMSAGC017_00753 [Thomasclavelia cocleata]|uniref:Prolow-density lipoprotein receptor-related protein 1-like beta-propeller domain-containing protein n=1 Tax=Thomasclavelia cocleata TaxID=69824 RepID=A0A829ZBF6_9FIRM|nr:DUF5050 domain-containing protein [Thomasclavelia cocleata]GFI40718.1 hypothetical protein IMSAGC017_00753 [Thomasclavelia cocleata]
MIKYELKKNLIYNKFWILILLVIGLVFFGNLHSNNQISNLENQDYQFYYNNLHGKMYQNKIDFINNEEKNINGFKEKSDSLENEYKSGKITDEQYIDELDKLNTYHYRAQIFDEISEYIDYLSKDSNRSYINENNMDAYLNNDFSYFIIVMIILDVIISFQNEESMYLVSKTTINGKNRLIKSKVFTLSIINLIVFITIFLLNFILSFNLDYISDLFATLDSTRLFLGTSFHGNILCYIFLCFFMKIIAILLLTCITSILCLKSRIDGIKLCILEMSAYIIFFLLFKNVKWIYYMIPIGFFNPNRYFLGTITNVSGETIMPFKEKELVVVLIILILLIFMIFLKKRKIFQIPFLICMCIIMNGCQNKDYKQTDIMYENLNGFYVNDNLIINTVENQMVDLINNKKYEINRNVLKDIDNISTGFMYYQYFYFIEMGEDEWSLQKLDTCTFEQEEVYKKSFFKYDILGNIISTSRYNLPNQIYVDCDKVFISYYNRIEVLEKNNTEILFNGYGQILKVERDNIYFINDKKQVEEFNIKTKKHIVRVKSLVSSAFVDDRYIYYTSLKDGNLYKANRDSYEKDLILKEQVNFFQIIGDQLYYTLVGENGLHCISFKTQTKASIIPNIDVYAFIVIDSKIFFTAMDQELNKISWFVFDGIKISRINM